ncbi:hypothetical protein [Streptomyces mirabilis]|uniref:hypothetical protein n=1 Tax=Streptomyces mirabilis TaxID=68239 RepID=UPI0015A66004|nr:hypothetical protein [Streptomyces mirabilis]
MPSSTAPEATVAERPTRNSDQSTIEESSGFIGMRRRVAALDGAVRLTSPVGGPTVIEVDLPYAW